MESMLGGDERLRGAGTVAETGTGTEEATGAGAGAGLGQQQ